MNGLSMQGGLSLLSVISAAAAHSGSKYALLSPERNVSYSDFCNNVVRLSAELLSIGLAPGDRVALLDTDSTEYLELFQAIGVAGLIAVPLNYRQKAEELAFQIADSGARLLLAGSRYTAEAGILGKDLDLGWRPLLLFHREAVSKKGLLPTPQEANPHAAFAICYTSGTTGRPKGATISQHAVCLRALKFVAEFGVVREDVVHVTPPLFHISGVVLNLMGLMRGCSVLIMPQFRFDETVAAMQQHRVSFVCLVPTILAMMVQSPEFGSAMFGSLRIIMYAGAPMSPKLIREIISAYGGEIVQSLGQTEDLPQLILGALEHRNAFAADGPVLSAIGKPAIGTEIKICNSEGRRVPDGEVGEIVSRGGTGMIGYWNLPEATAETLRDGWVHSGDLGYVGSDGFVYLAGRKKQMIIRGGENVYPAEVERVLTSAPGVIDAVVLGTPHDVWGETVTAVVVATEESRNEAALINFCRGRLASYRCPERVVYRDSLPYNAGGKVDRSLLRKEIDRTQDVS